VNPGTGTARLRISIANLFGTARGTALDVPLSAAEQTSLFVSQLFPDLPQGFRGMTLIQSDVPVAVMAMRSTDAGGRFMVATLPVVDLTKPAALKTIFFPHLADGAGYSSEFILMNPCSEACMTSLRFFSQSGTALPLVSR
jgi:hypothetical protein